jgi:hypothetical protein
MALDGKVCVIIFSFNQGHLCIIAWGFIICHHQYAMPTAFGCTQPILATTDMPCLRHFYKNPQVVEVINMPLFYLTPA